MNKYYEAREHRLRVGALELGVVMTGVWMNLGGVMGSYLGPEKSWRMGK